ncbi:cobalamin biosynthesis protein CobD [Sporosarcina sp. Marseille-Q4063]|uniref:adenosylcobinamide-phosphate synthase CbiB n=1 Tax=Sporosarcina sp. Marseille-Q4063 TaxID=2810514 RepID=UPI001BAE8A0C|nr:cobalamin biosynthesis protein CobD [Sporosarcina sp. Marseille-Q4063]
MPAHFIAISIGFLLDRIIGDPPNWPHPVRWIGTFISKMTSRLNKGKYRTLKGAIVLFLTVLIVFAIVFVIVEFAYSLHILTGIAIESVLIAIGLAQKSLRDAALDVYNPLVAGEITEARTKLSWIVGRDTDKLDESEISRATIETVSENIADGVTSPLFWAFLLGAPGLWLYKAVNTLDSMIGYRDERYEKFGKFSARADDLLNLIPARITGLLMILYAPNKSHLPFLKRFSGWLKDARRHPSPNSGYLEAATAWQLGVSLGGKATYRGRKSERPKLGPGLVPLDATHIKATIFELDVISFFFWFIGTVLGVLINAIT